MSVATSKPWEHLDERTRRELDARYLDELRSWAEPGLSEDAVEAYLTYRRERPDAAITTYEEGQIRRLLHGMSDPARVPDPVEQEEHVDPIEVFGARWLHLTNTQSYVAVMVSLTFAALLAFLIVLLLMD